IVNLPDRYAERLARFRQFSTTAVEAEHLPAFADYSVDAADFTAFDALVDAFDDALHAADGARAASQDRTTTRDASVDGMDDWMGRMHGIARLALKDRPQLLEKLGLIAR
ncbi:MAG TPA: hypothetical protein VD962_02640, partial [Rubricoccaceae bacterium]|nr:hypothetical protein [Rubricoccaceae bacterium]